MPRVTSAVARNKRKKKVLKAAKATSGEGKTYIGQRKMQ